MPPQAIGQNIHFLPPQVCVCRCVCMWHAWMCVCGMLESVFVCTCVACLSVCVVCLSVCVCEMLEYVCVYAWVHKCKCVLVCVWMGIHACECLEMCVFMSVGMYLCMCVCVECVQDRYVECGGTCMCVCGVGVCVYVCVQDVCVCGVECVWDVMNTWQG